jgi:hypothetical protein
MPDRAPSFFVAAFDTIQQNGPVQREFQLLNSVFHPTGAVQFSAGQRRWKITLH